MPCQACSFQNQEGITFCGQCGIKLDSTVNMRAVHISAAIDFVDRQREMGELVSALDDAMSGQGRVVMLAGYPGIGKTRTAQEFAAIAETRNAEVFWGHCYEDEGALPYWPWLQIIRSHIDQSDVESLKASMGSGAEAIGEIVPELISKLTDLGSPPRFASSSARFRLFDSITTYLKNVSVDKPMVLILEDLHCAAASSLALLEHAAADVSASNLMIIGTYRDIEVSTEHPLSRTLGSFVQHDGFQRLQLGGLSHAVRKVDASTGIISAVAGGLGDEGPTGDGGPDTSATLRSPSGVAVGASVNIFIADRQNNAIRTVLLR